MSHLFENILKRLLDQYGQSQAYSVGFHNNMKQIAMQGDA
jgi:hypothetical protein